MPTMLVDWQWWNEHMNEDTGIGVFALHPEVLVWHGRWGNAVRKSVRPEGIRATSAPMNPQLKMSLRPTTLLLSLALLVAVVHAAPINPCTPSTCPPGPVYAYFTTTDCSGAATFQTYGASEMGTCQESNGGSIIYAETAEFVTYFEVNNPSCDMTFANASYFMEQFYYGKCRYRNNLGRDGQAATSSWMMLANVNATYTSPQPAPNVIMTYPNVYTDIITQPCDSPSNCTREGVPAIFSSTSHTSECAATSSYGTYNASYDGTCYRVSDLYYTSSNCIDDHAYVAREYTGDGCQNLVYVEYNRRVCVPNTGNTESYNCTATPIAFPPFPAPAAPVMPSAPSTPSATPTSAASSLLPSFFIVLALAIVLFWADMSRFCIVRQMKMVLFTKVLLKLLTDSDHQTDHKRISSVNWGWTEGWTLSIRSLSITVQKLRRLQYSGPIAARNVEIGWICSSLRLVIDLGKEPTAPWLKMALLQFK